MKVSIITSVFNNKETIADAIDSVLSQDYKNIEYIVIDGGSSDGTVDIVKSYGDRVSKFISEKDRGIYDGLNRGLSLASGGVVGFLHSDDIYAKRSIISEVVERFEKGCAGVYGDLVYTTKIDTDRIIRYWKSREFDISLLKKGWMPPHPTLFLKKEIYDRVGGFDLDFKIAADYDFMLRVLKENPNVCYMDKILYKMRLGGESNKSLKNIINKSKEDYRALKKNGIGGICTLLSKNFSKLGQFIKKSVE
jgi:glycosyltransferase